VRLTIRNLGRFSILGGLFFIIFSATVYALESSSAGFAPQGTYLAGAAEPVKYLARSFFYILLMVAVLVLLRKFFLPQGFTIPGQEQFRVLRKLPLEQQSALYLVRAGDAVLLLGVGAKQISLLKEMTLIEAEPLLAQQMAAQVPVVDTFKKYLAEYMGRKK